MSNGIRRNGVLATLLLALFVPLMIAQGVGCWNQPPPPVTPQLFITSFTRNSVISYLNPSGVDGNIAPDTDLSGGSTQLDQPIDVVVNAAQELIVSSFRAGRVTTYTNAPGATGNLAPDGNVQGAATTLTNPVSLAYNAAQDLLLVANLATQQILAFPNASLPDFTGDPAPARVITSAGLSGDMKGINFGAGDDLYVAKRNPTNNVVVFANASSLDGTVAPDRTLTSAAFTDVVDVFVDANDTLFVVNTGGTINIFTNAASLDGTVSPTSTLWIPGTAGNLISIVVDAGGVGYIADTGSPAAVYVYDNISTLDGAILPHRTIRGANTLLNDLRGLFLLE